jgi:hypothetical protein
MKFRFVLEITWPKNMLKTTRVDAEFNGGVLTSLRPSVDLGIFGV